jgi:hypothetical protein
VGSGVVVIGYHLQWFRFTPKWAALLCGVVDMDDRHPGAIEIYLIMQTRCIFRRVHYTQE